MDVHMHFQTAVVRETFITNGAFERTFSCMDPHMRFQIAFVRETLTTYGAFVWALSSVGGTLDV